MAIAGHVGAVYIETNDPPTAFTKKPTQADVSFTRYEIIDASSRYWDKNTPVLVYVNDELVSTGYELEYCGGVVVFGAGLTEEDSVTVSGMSLTVTQRGGFFNWSCELASDTSEVTTFQSEGWKENLPTIKGFTASADSYWGDSEFSESLGKEVIIALYVDNTASQKRYEGYVVISSDSIETAVDDIINESIEFEGTGRLYYRED
ncbi:MAG: hypothetical protein U9N81_08440 [Bacillota bacterium]|nr:hypothetical protein [Bacillota bacterium]